MEHLQLKTPPTSLQFFGPSSIGYLKAWTSMPPGPHLPLNQQRPLQATSFAPMVRWGNLPRQMGKPPPFNYRFHSIPSCWLSQVEKSSLKLASFLTSGENLWHRSNSIPPKILGAWRHLVGDCFNRHFQTPTVQPYLCGISDIVVTMGCHDGHGNAGTSNTRYQPMVAMGQRTDLVIVQHRNFEVPKPQCNRFPTPRNQALWRDYGSLPFQKFPWLHD